MNENRRPVMLAALVLGVSIIGCESTDDPFARKHSDWMTGGLTDSALSSKGGLAPKLLPATYFAAAKLFEKQGQLEQAARKYADAISVSHEFLAAYNRLGIVLTKLGRFEKADDALIRAIELVPDKAYLRNNLAFSYILQKRWADAEAELTNALHLQPSFVRARINLGMVQAKQSRFADAFETFQTVLPKADAYYNMGMLFNILARYQDAATAFQRAKKLQPAMTVAQTQLDALAKRLAEPQPDEPRAVFTEEGIADAASAPDEQHEQITATQSDVALAAASEEKAPNETQAAEETKVVSNSDSSLKVSPKEATEKELAAEKKDRPTEPIKTVATEASPAVTETTPEPIKQEIAEPAPALVAEKQTTTNKKMEEPKVAASEIESTSKTPIEVAPLAEETQLAASAEGDAAQPAPAPELEKAGVQAEENAGGAPIAAVLPEATPERVGPPAPDPQEQRDGPVVVFHFEHHRPDFTAIPTVKRDTSVAKGASQEHPVRVAQAEHDEPLDEVATPATSTESAKGEPDAELPKQTEEPVTEESDPSAESATDTTQETEAPAAHEATDLPKATEEDSTQPTNESVSEIDALSPEEEALEVDVDEPASTPFRERETRVRATVTVQPKVDRDMEATSPPVETPAEQQETQSAALEELMVDHSENESTDADLLIEEEGIADAAPQADGDQISTVLVEQKKSDPIIASQPQKVSLLPMVNFEHQRPDFSYIPTAGGGDPKLIREVVDRFQRRLLNMMTSMQTLAVQAVATAAFEASAGETDPNLYGHQGNADGHDVSAESPMPDMAEPQVPEEPVLSLNKLPIRILVTRRGTEDVD